MKSLEELAGLLPANNVQTTSLVYIIIIVRQQIVEKITNGEVVQHTVFPTTGQTYGTEYSDYPGKFNLLDTLSNSVDEFRNLGFKQTITISLVAAADDWQKWLKLRFPEPSEEATKRLEEAVQSINWSLADSQTFWLVNSSSNLDETARKLVEIARTREGDEQARKYAHDMLKLIEGGIW